MTPLALALEELHPAVGDPLLTSMNFLNEVAGRYPGALSLAAGTPYEGFYEVEDVHRALRVFCDELRGPGGRTEEQVRRTLLQYGRTKGIIHELISRQLASDEGIHIDPEAIVVTTGCQEALFLTLSVLRRDARDVLLSVTPAYIGATGAARLLDLPVRPVPEGPDGIDLTALSEAVARARGEGLRPRALYLVPDHANPSGLRMPLSVRRELLALAEREDILLLEDNPYGLFPLDGERLPTLKALDTGRRVIHLGSLSKTVFPGVRVGYAIADQPAEGGPYLADLLARAKSMVTVNTSPIAQAVAGGRLLEHDCSLVAATRREAEVYREGLRRMLDGLAERLPTASGVRWNVPAGGFFVVVEVPFEVTPEVLETSAGDYGVLWTPLHHFYGSQVPLRCLRLSCSAIDPADMPRALDRFASFVDAMRKAHAAR